MNKKLVLTIIVCVLLVIPTFVMAIETEMYKIDYPEGFSQTASENIYTNEEGNAIVISIQDADQVGSLKFTEEFLNGVVDTFTKNIDSIRDEIKESMYEQYSDILTSEYIEEYANKVKIEAIEKEITTFGKGNYKCFHYIVNVDMVDYSYYSEYYQTQSGNNVISISLSANDLSFFEKDTIKNAINSFEIKNYKEPMETLNVSDLSNTISENFSKNLSDNLYNKTEQFLIYACIAISVLGLIGIIKKGKSKKDNKKTTNEDEKINTKNEIPKDEAKDEAKDEDKE